MKFVKYACAALLLTESEAIKVKLTEQLRQLSKVSDQKDQYLLLKNKASSKGVKLPHDVDDIMVPEKELNSYGEYDPNVDYSSYGYVQIPEKENESYGDSSYGYVQIPEKENNGYGDSSYGYVQIPEEEYISYDSNGFH